MEMGNARLFLRRERKSRWNSRFFSTLNEESQEMFHGTAGTTIPRQNRPVFNHLSSSFSFFLSSFSSSTKYHSRAVTFDEGRKRLCALENQAARASNTVQFCLRVIIVRYSRHARAARKTRGDHHRRVC